MRLWFLGMLLAVGAFAQDGGMQLITLSGGEHGGLKMPWTANDVDSGFEVMVLGDGCKYRLTAELKAGKPWQATYIGGK